MNLRHVITTESKSEKHQSECRSFYFLERSRRAEDGEESPSGAAEMGFAGEGDL